MFFEVFKYHTFLKSLKCVCPGADAYVSNLPERELYDYFCKVDGFTPKEGQSLSGFAPDWIGQFYARSQWQKNVQCERILGFNSSWKF